MALRWLIICYMNFTSIKKMCSEQNWEPGKHADKISMKQ